MRDPPLLDGRPLGAARLQVGRRLHLAPPEAQGPRRPGAAQDERRAADGELSDQPRAGVRRDCAR